MSWEPEKKEVSRLQIGRNDPCWCGSGRKYKHCHLDRENQTPIPFREHSKEIKRKFAAKTCLAPSAWLDKCSGKIVRAHTVPKSGSLQQIAQDGHVYSFVPSLEYVEKNHGPGPTLWGINKASTFSGFCSHHDNTTFAPLEKQVFGGTSEQCFLLGYRALAVELYKKHAASQISSLQNADKGIPLEAQVEFQLIPIKPLQNRAPKASIPGLKPLQVQHTTKCSKNREFDTIRAYVIELRRTHHQ